MNLKYSNDLLEQINNLNKLNKNLNSHISSINLQHNEDIKKINSSHISLSKSYTNEIELLNIKTNKQSLDIETLISQNNELDDDYNELSNNYNQLNIKYQE